VRLAVGRLPMHPPPHLMMLAPSRIQNIIHKTLTQLPTYNNVRRLAAPAACPQHPMTLTLAACNTATRHVPPALALAP